MTTAKPMLSRRIENVISEDGEVIPTIRCGLEDGDFNFHKLWLGHFLSSMDEIANQKMKLALWIIDNIDKDNILPMTQEEIIKQTGLSRSTVERTMIALQIGEPAFLKKVKRGKYQINPDILYKGEHKKRMAVVYDYNGEKEKDKKVETDANNQVTAARENNLANFRKKKLKNLYLAQNTKYKKSRIINCS